MIRAISALHLLRLSKRKQKMINNKKGIIRIIEAAIAIFMLMAFLAIIVTGNIQKPNLSESAYTIGHQILREVSNNYSLRQDVLKNQTSSLDAAIYKRLSAFAFDFETAVCDPSESCLCTTCPGDTEIYADDIIISTNLSDYSPKKLSLFMWIAIGGKKTTVCADECNPAGSKTCEGNSWKQCGNYDADSCLEWSGLTSCGSQTCDGGICKTITPICTAHYECSADGKTLKEIKANCNEVTTPAPHCSEQRGVCLGATKTCDLTQTDKWKDCTDADYLANNPRFTSPLYTGEKRGVRIGGTLVCMDNYDNDCDGALNDDDIGCGGTEGS